MRIVCFQCKKEIGEKAPFSDNEATHALCDPCLGETLQRLREERKRKGLQGNPDVALTSEE